MKCPACEAKGLSSRVLTGGRTQTLLGWVSYFDEAGVEHQHDPNRQHRIYSCTNGHSFEVISRPPCPAGDYPNELAQTRMFGVSEPGPRS